MSRTMKKTIEVDLVKLGTASRNMSAMARKLKDDSMSNRLAALSEKILLVPKVKLTATELETMKFYLDNC